MDNSSDGNIVYKRWTVWRVVSLLLLLSIIAFWIWALSPLAPQGHPDKLDDPAFAIAAKPLCADAKSSLEELPLALTTKTPDERADLIDEGTTIYRELLEALRLLARDQNTDDGKNINLSLFMFLSVAGHRWKEYFLIWMILVSKLYIPM